MGEGGLNIFLAGGGNYDIPGPSGRYSRDWSESAKVIGAISEPFVVNEDSGY